LTLDYLLCQKHLEKLGKRKGNDWVMDILEQEHKDWFEDFTTDKCEQLRLGKRCNKKGVAIAKYKMADPPSVKMNLVDVTHFGNKWVKKK